MMGVNGGTTDPMTMAVIDDRAILSCAKRPVTISPTSSAVRSRNVSSRQLTRRSLPSNTPRTMLVLPTSIAKSIEFQVPRSRPQVLPKVLRSHSQFSQSTPDFARHDAVDAITDSHQQRAMAVDAGGDARLRARRRRPRHASALAGRRTGAPSVENSIEPPGEQVVVASGQSGERFSEHRGRSTGRPSSLSSDVARADSSGG